MERPPAFDAETDPVDIIRALGRTLSRIYHDTNNPLAIVSGNAQFLLELAKSMGLDEDLVQPMKDIEEASERVAEGLREISRLRDDLQTYVRSRGTS
ncbi:MAG: histidine kinase dimerization/phospho-acceptor domain-containing protein [Rhodothermales bacterium]